MTLLTIPAFTQSSYRKGLDAYNSGMKYYKQDTFEGYKNAVNVLNQARNLYQQEGDKAGEALSLFRIGQSYRKLNDLKNAFYSYDAAFNIYKQLGKKKEMIFASQNMAAVQRDNNQYKDAIKTYENDVFPSILRLGSKKDIAKAYNGLGHSYLGIGENTKALNNFKRSLSNWRLVKSKDYDKIRANYGSAIAHYRLGNKTAAKNFGNIALNLSRRENDPVFKVEVLEALAQVYDDDGDKKTAVQYRLQALKVYDQARDRVSIHAYDSVVNNLADVYYRMGNLDAAYKLLNANIISNVNGKQRPNQSYLAATLGEVYTAQGKYNLAIEALNTALRIAAESENKNSAAYSLACLGEVYLYIASLTDEDYSEAIKSYETVLKYYKPGEYPYVETKVITGLIIAYKYNNQLSSARSLVDRIQNTGMDKGNSVSAILALEAIGKYYGFVGQHKEALSYFNKAFVLADKRKNLFEGAKILNNSLNSFFALQNYQIALNNSKITMNIYKSFGNKYFEAYSNISAGWASLNLRQYDQAISYANRSLEIANSSNEKAFQNSIQINSFHINGKANFFNGNPAAAIDYFNQSLNLAKSTSDKQSQKHFWTDLAITYESMGDKKQAKKARKKADKIK